MIIRRDGIVVGMLDDKSLKLTDVTSAELQELVDDLRENGMFRMGSQDEELGKGQASGDIGREIPFTPENIAFIEMDLLTAGFDVQTA